MGHSQLHDLPPRNRPPRDSLAARKLRLRLVEPRGNLPPMDAERRQAVARGLRFDQFALGDVHVSQGRTVTEADIVAFAGLSGDYNPLHTNEEHARRTIFRGRVAHGLLVHSIASGLANQTGIFDGTIAALREMLIRYEAPVRPGDTLRVELTVIDRDAQPSRKRGNVRFRVHVLNQNDETVNDGEWLALISR